MLDPARGAVAFSAARYGKHKVPDLAENVKLLPALQGPAPHRRLRLRRTAAQITADEAAAGEAWT
jgi:hypothetical protein